MPAGQGTIGRNIVFKWNGVKIAGVREKAVAINGEPIDVTDDDSSGWREVLSDDGSRSVDLTISGVMKTQLFRQLKLAGGAGTIGAVRLEYPDGSVIAGDFKLVNVNETGTYNDATTFEAPLQSSGAVAYTPAP